MNSVSVILLTLSLILFSGFAVTRLTKRLNLPNVSGYIIAGVLIGPGALNLVPQHVLSQMGFISDIALAFIAFGVGKFFKKKVFAQAGKKVILITLSEALTAGLLVSLTMYVFFRQDLLFSLLLGAIATATAPASTMMTINQYHAKGEFVNILLQVVAFDDVVCLMVFSIVSAVVNSEFSGTLRIADILLPIVYNLLAIGLGILCAFLLSRLLSPARSNENRLILTIAMLLGISGLCSAFDVSPLLSCMFFGAFYINLTHDKSLFRQINRFTPPVLSMFFIVSGMNLDTGALRTYGIIGFFYFIVRIIGKYLGAFLGCALTKTSAQIRNYLGFALIPQAGVAIGLAFLGRRMLPAATGDMLLTLILSSSVLYELIGPVCAKLALFSSGAIQKKKG